MGDVFIWGLFDHAVIAPAVWGTPRDLAAIERITSTEIPPVLDYLERSCPPQASCLASLASPTSRSPCSCATPRSPATGSTSPGGR